MATLYSLDQDNQNEAQHEFFDVILLALASASCDANDIITRTIALLRSR